jgi:LysR family nod box-dependent transcriptional activator
MIPRQFSSDSHPQTDLFEEEFICVAWVENSMVGETLTYEQYLALGHVSVVFGQNLLPSVEHLLLQQAGCHRRVEVYASGFALLPLLVVGTNRVATMHLRLAKQAAAALPLRLLPLPIPLPQMTEVMQWPAHHSGEPGSLWLRRIIQETAARL